MKKRQITGWRLHGGSAGGTTSKRLRRATDANRGKAGWIAETGSHYFTKITATFLTRRKRRKTKGSRFPTCASVARQSSVDCRRRFGAERQRGRTASSRPSRKPAPRNAFTHLDTAERNRMAPRANVVALSRLRHERYREHAKVLRVFPWSAVIFDRGMGNAHIISTALPTAVGPSLRRSGSASGAGETLAQCKTHHVVFPNQTSPSGISRAGPRKHFSTAGPSPRLGRVPCSRPGCCSIAQVMPPLPV